ncbi:unnamed protein product [Trichobilharzia regenti]|nr:unnamed protein product [Trichobilharzia regenti]
MFIGILNAYRILPRFRSRNSLKRLDTSHWRALHPPSSLNILVYTSLLLLMCLIAFKLTMGSCHYYYYYYYYYYNHRQYYDYGDHADHHGDNKQNEEQQQQQQRQLQSLDYLFLIGMTQLKEIFYHIGGIFDLLGNYDPFFMIPTCQGSSLFEELVNLSQVIERKGEIDGFFFYVCVCVFDSLEILFCGVNYYAY